MIFTVFIVCFLHVPGIKGAFDTKRIVQTPLSIIKRTGESVDSDCSHDTDNFENILWFKQEQDKAPEYLGHLNLNFLYVEAGVRGKISLKGDGRKHSNLTVSNLSLSDSGVYFCAARRHSAAESSQVHTKTSESTPDKQHVQAAEHLQ
ncbi:unnamed protein product [Pleuronectes platessa]|uniref:Ig-like domain-containing protein n=1 Tax=Pleuronectes platessa TaxID=8262 RepID=A0A9N7Z694_PLEPL|nr:unnamed protein product [Pleuronectes platessa]